MFKSKMLSVIRADANVSFSETVSPDEKLSAIGRRTDVNFEHWVSHRTEPQRQAARRPGRGVPYRGRGQAPRVQHYQSQPYYGQSNYQSGCRNCGLIHGLRQCPAYNKNCNKCHALGHFAKCCQNKTLHYAEHDSYNDDMYYDNFFAENEAMETLTVYATKKCDVKQVNSVKNDVMTVQFQTTRDDVVKFKIDTAADCSVLTKASYDKMINKPKLRPGKVAIRVSLVIQPKHVVQ